MVRGFEIKTNKEHIHIQVDTDMGTWGKTTYGVINTKTLLVEKVLIKIKFPNMIHQNRERNYQRYYLHVQWDKYRNPIFIRYMEEDLGEVRTNKNMNLTWDTQGELKSYLDIHGNYWNKDLFSIPEPFKIQNTLNRIIPIIQEFLGQMNQYSRMIFKTDNEHTSILTSPHSDDDEKKIKLQEKIEELSTNIQKNWDVYGKLIRS